MYVALTRARKRVFILTQGQRESPFVAELERGHSNQNGAREYGCPYCKNGKRVQRKGKHGLFWTCSRYPACSGKAPQRGRSRRSR